MEREQRVRENLAGRDLGREVVCKVILGYTLSRRPVWATWTLSQITELEMSSFFCRL